MGPTPLPPSKAPAKAALLGRRMFKRELGLSRFLDLPLLRKQKSFTDEITLSPGSLDAIAISLWENRADAEAYNTDTYPEMVKTLARMIEGTPKVPTFEAVTSTLHKVAVAA